MYEAFGVPMPSIYRLVALNEGVGWSCTSVFMALQRVLVQFYRPVPSLTTKIRPLNGLISSDYPQLPAGVYRSRSLHPVEEGGIRR